MQIDLLNGDCLKRLGGLQENSVDSIVTDPPYELGFMGKGWDKTGIANNVELWSECLRVLKPGGHLLAFSGTRTYHRMASAIEDAGFEVRDMIEWVYGSGFPKSLNIGKSVNQLETNEWSKIGKALDNIDQKSIIKIWKSNSNNVKIVETQSLKNQIIAGQDTLSENFVVLNVVQNSNQENSNLLVSFAEQNLNEVQAINTKINTALPSVEAEIRQLQDNVKSAEQQSQNQNHKSWSIFTAQCDVKEWLKENTMVNHKVDEALKTLRGNKKYSNEEITSVLCAGLTDILKLTILSQSNTFQNLDTKSQTDFLSATNVIITEYTAENLISNMVDILKSKAVDKLQGNEREVVGQDRSGSERNCMAGDFAGGEYDLTKGTSEWEGWGTALKPAHEPICMARKPLSEKTVAENCLKWGTGGINIDESRVGTEGGGTHCDNRDAEGNCLGHNNAGKSTSGETIHAKENGEVMGRFPANLIHDNSEEVRECFPETNSKWGKSSGVDVDPDQCSSFKIGLDGQGIKERTNKFTGDSGNTSRFFKSINISGVGEIEDTTVGEDYRASQKAGTPQRLEATDGASPSLPTNFKSIIYQAKASKKDRGVGNNHPTVKSVALMEYLIKMVTPKGGIVLDPFMGSGSTGVAAKRSGYGFIGIELDKDYFEIASHRIA